MNCTQFFQAYLCKLFSHQEKLNNDLKISKNIQMALLEDLNWRHAVKGYDATKKVSTEDLYKI